MSKEGYRCIGRKRNSDDKLSATMWVCIANEKYVDQNSLALTRRESIQREVERAMQIQPDLDWEELKRWGYKCVKANVKIEI